MLPERTVGPFVCQRGPLLLAGRTRVDYRG
jgi:hypothetical protein